MLQVLDGYPEGTLAVRGTGTVTAEDYRTVLEPAFETALESERPIRLLYVLGDGFEGYAPSALVEDGVFGTSEFRHVERLAVVTDTPWVRHALALFGKFMPGHVRLYATAEMDAAQAWIAEA